MEPGTIQVGTFEVRFPEVSPTSDRHSRCPTVLEYVTEVVFSEIRRFFPAARLANDRVEALPRHARHLAPFRIAYRVLYEGAASDAKRILQTRQATKTPSMRRTFQALILYAI